VRHLILASKKGISAQRHWRCTGFGSLITAWWIDDREEVIIIAPCGIRPSLRCLEGRLSWPGVEFIDENGSGPCVRLRNRQQKRLTRPVT